MLTGLMQTTMKRYNHVEGLITLPTHSFVEDVDEVPGVFSLFDDNDDEPATSPSTELDR
jgi:hypothetical protein